ncbi:hypothetical protein AB7849_15275 [Rhodanobacter sp. 115]|uniref:hypothetical protein n=1 Tax=Rhodanobacter sp. FW021-MT20 TaxID=1162282 RepID=UPI0034E5EEEB
MIVDREAIRRGDRQALRQLQVVVQRVAIGVARKYGLYDSEDDIAQEAMLATLRATSVPRQDEALIHIEGFIKEAARRLALSHMRNRSRTVSVESDDEFDANADIRHDATLEAVQEFQERAAIERALALRPSVVSSAVVTEPAPERAHRKPKRARPPERVKKRTTTTNNELKPNSDGGRVTAVRRMLGLTQAQFANHLQISIHTLRNYEYGVVKKVPATTMAKVKNAKARGLATGYTARQQPFLKKARGWMKDLGLRRNDYSGLAAALGFNRSTVWRWFANDVVPARRIIDTADAYVSELVSRRAEHDAASRHGGGST